MSTNLVIIWLRRDLRLQDNPAVFQAVKTGAQVLPVYIYDEHAPFAPGAAARWWLHHSLKALSADLKALGAPLILRRGDEAQTLHALAKQTGARAVFWNRRYAPAEIAIDKQIMARLKDEGVEVSSFNGTLLREPWELKTGAGAFYKVFTPFWRALQAAGPARDDIYKAPAAIQSPRKKPASDRLNAWGLTPSKPNWAREFSDVWTPGETGAQQRLNAFLDRGAFDYAENRNRPDIEATSRLSPHLAFGEIGPLQIWRAAFSRMEEATLKNHENAIDSEQALKFLSEVAWREFSYGLLYHYEGLRDAPLRPAFEAFPWREDARALHAWQQGQTGYPIVDAGMRELWRTGWMHNRVRMIVASFLIKHLLIPWQEGEKWFWDTLVDADPANNPASWQWTAGCGADAAPYFRIFNPITQGEKFDPQGVYTTRYVPEIADLTQKYRQRPWEAPAPILKQAGLQLGADYPEPLVDHSAARKRALAAFEMTKTQPI